MFNSNKCVSEDQLKKIKLKPYFRAGPLWKGIPLHEVATMFKETLKTSGFGIWNDAKFAVYSDKSDIAISVPMNAHKWNTPKVSPIIGLTYSNSQKFLPTLYMGVESTIDKGLYVLCQQKTSDRRRSPTFDLKANFLNEAVHDMLMDSFTLNHLNVNISQLQNRYLKRSDHCTLLCRIAREKILTWSRIGKVDAYVYSSTKSVSLLDFCFEVNRAMRLNEPTKQPKQLFDLYNIMSSYSLTANV